MLSLTGFSLVGGPAYNDARAAETMLAGLDVPYIAAHPLEFQTVEQWREDARGLTPVEATMMVAIPELDGAIGPMTFGGRSSSMNTAGDMAAIPDRVAMLASRVAKLVALRNGARAGRKLAIVLFNFPPNGGSAGTAAYLSVFESLHNTMKALQAAGYAVEVPPTVEDLRARVLKGNAGRFGTDANVASRIPVDSHVRRERWLAEIEKQWGPAPGRHQTRWRPTFWCSANSSAICSSACSRPSATKAIRCGCCSRRGFAPTHAFAAFYRWIREDFARRCGAAFRHPWRARIHAGQAGRDVRRMLAGPADRRFAEFLSLRIQQSIRGRACQAARRGDADQLFDAFDRAGGTLSRTSST